MINPKYINCNIMHAKILFIQVQIYDTEYETGIKYPIYLILDPRVQMSYIRIKPESFHNYVAMRVEVYGIHVGKSTYYI